jgi:DNA invertase Pin-like site-specific DNA recombinase
MTRQAWAITTCRVSSSEQLENNSLGRQQEAVINMAEELGAYIPEDGQWSGSVSSKAGTNLNRKDLQEMLDYCKKHRQVKYLIVHEVDRFMRSIKELFYFEVEFEKLGVKVIYASQPELNTDNYQTKLLKALEAFKSEGSNVERQVKSIGGATSAVKEGRYPFGIKPGYRKGAERGIQEIHSIRGPVLQSLLKRIASHQITPTKALVELNNSVFIQGHALYKMDKFRKIITDPFYAGIVEVDKQVKVRNEKGLHQPLITIEERNELVRIMNNKKKNQLGPKKGGNPKYPCNNIVACDYCIGKQYGRLVGFDHTNGKTSKVYEKYRCRSCGRYIARDELHAGVEQQFSSNKVDPDVKDLLLVALNAVWKDREGQIEQEINRFNHRIDKLRTSINQQVEAVAEPGNALIKEDLMMSIVRKKEELISLEDNIAELQSEAKINRADFVKFAFSFIDETGDKFLDLPTELRSRCKQIIFPSGFYLDKNKNVYTPEISPIYSLAVNKKGAEAPKIDQMVRVMRL